MMREGWKLLHTGDEVGSFLAYDNEITIDRVRPGLVLAHEDKVGTRLFIAILTQEAMNTRNCSN